MTGHGEKLRELTSRVVDSDQPVTAFGLEMMELGLLLRKGADARKEFVELKGMNDPTASGTGFALDPWRASLSLEDRGRTAAFVRGGVRAVEALLEKHPGRAVHFMEAGCGPLATLSVPLMARFDPDQLQVTLVDLHQESLDSAKQVIDWLGLSDRLKSTKRDDLMTADLDQTVDIVGLETMFAALIREPQVALTRRLVRALPDTLILPETISVDLQLVNLAQESTTLPPAPNARKFLGRVFELDRATALGFDENAHHLPAATVTIPKAVEPGQELYLTTAVRVFGDVSIADYDAEITMPIAIPNAEPSWLGRDLNFRYRISEDPGLEWSVE